METIKPFFILMGAIFAGMIVFAYVVKVLEVRKARTWKTIPGKIIQSKIRVNIRKDLEGKSIRENVPDVIYEYEVSGKRYRGERISFAERITGADLEAALKRYPIGANVQVSYNPRNPKEAVLEREMPAHMGKSISLLALFFIAACLVVPLALGSAAEWLAPRLPNPDRATFTALSGAIGLLVLIFALAVQSEVWRARNWRSTSGRILGAESEAFRAWTTRGERSVLSTFYRPVIVYSFNAEGRDYVSDRVAFGGQAGWSSSAFFRRLLAKYPEDSPVTVYYNPVNPSEAVLERRAWGIWLLVGMGVLLVGLAAYAGWV